MVEREVGYYLIYAFLPSAMCVILSWAGFWIKITVSPARYNFLYCISPISELTFRVALGVTCYLSVKTLAYSFQTGMPRVSYVKVESDNLF